MQPDDTICYCFHITKRKIFNFLRIHQPRVPSQIHECGGAGTGCGWCVPFLKKYFHEVCPNARRSYHDENAEEFSSQEADLTAEEYAKQRGAYIKAGQGTPAPGAIPIPSEIDVEEE